MKAQEGIQLVNEFRSDSLPFAAFLLSSRKLRLLRCELATTNGRVMFVFEDPEHVAEGLYSDFATGAETPAAAFFDAIRHLRKIMDQTKQNMNHGAQEHGFSSR